MNVRHQQTVAADGRLERLRGPAIYRRVLANDRPVSDLDRRFLAGELEILRRTAEYRPHPDLNILAEGNVPLEGRSRRDNAAAGNDAVVADDYERADLDISGDFRLARHDRRRMDPRRHRPRTIAAMSASATTSPSTLPTPRILQTGPRSCVIS